MPAPSPLPVLPAPGYPVDISNLLDSDLYPYGGLERNRRIVTCRYSPEMRWTYKAIAEQEGLHYQTVQRICKITSLRQQRRRAK